MADFEKLGQFYLGREHDLEAGRTATDRPLLYDARDLTTHAVCLGMTGSGKTGLCVSLLEEAAIDGIPGIALDLKGDIANLMLTFPGLTADDFRPWVDPGEAMRRGQTPDEYAQATAELWSRGLAEWGQDGDRIRRLRDAAEIAVYTPASDAGRQLAILRSFSVPPAAVLEDAEVLRERISSAVSGLLTLLGINADPISSREHILLSTILHNAWSDGQDVDMGALIRSIQAPPFDKVGFLDLESFFPADDRFQLAMALNNMLASPGFAAWMDGEALDIQRLLYTPEGKPRLAVLSIAHLTEQERMFFMTILLNEFIAWMRAQPGTTSLRALLYIDEVFGYLPPTANPPSKKPLLTLMKQARAYGIGCILATQNPVDLDYKSLSNAGTWFLGRLQTERDKLRVIEGLEGAATTSGAGFDRQRTEQILAGLGSRVFLMNNVHDDHPVVFHTRWAMSYLRGPMTRTQIEAVMQPLKQADSAQPKKFVAIQTPAADDRPVLPPEIPEIFVPVVTGNAGRIHYRPALLGRTRVHYVSSRDDLDYWDEVTLLSLPDGSDLPDNPWDAAEEWDEGDLPTPDDGPQSGSSFGALPSDFTKKRSYTSWGARLKETLYRDQRLQLWECERLDVTSKPGETETSFRIRIAQAAREERDLQIEKLRAKYGSRFNTLRDQRLRAEQRIEKESAQARQKKLSAGVSILTSIAGALFGRKLKSVTNVSRAGTAIRSAGGVAREMDDVRHAEQKLEQLVEKEARLAEELEAEIEEIRTAFDTDTIPLRKEDFKPRKSDLSVTQLTLAWLPYRTDASGGTTRAF